MSAYDDLVKARESLNTEINLNDEPRKVFVNKKIYKRIMRINKKRRNKL